MINIEKTIYDAIEEVPTLPTIYSVLSDTLVSPNANAADIAHLIASDQSASFKVLKVVNSPIYHLSSRVESISLAVLHLGFNEVRNIILALSVINLFSKKKLITSFRPVDFWKHSIGVGVVTRYIGNALQVPRPENYFLSGIMHDIGKLVLFENFSDQYENVLQYAEDRKCLIIDAEREMLGIDHTAAGAILAEKWKLPESVCRVIRGHHDCSFNEEKDILIAATHISDVTARILEFGYAGDDFVHKPNPKAWELLKLPNHFFTKSLDVLTASFDETVNSILNCD